jgi:hypothetical protein
VTLRLLTVLLAVCVAALFPAWAQAALPPNDDFANAADLGNQATASTTGSNLYGTGEADEPAHDGRFASASVWYRWTAPRDGVVRAETCGSGFDTVLAVYRGPALGELGRVAGNDDFCEEQSVVSFFALAGTTYWVAVDGFGGSQGTIVLELRFLDPPANDAFAAARDLGAGATASASGTNLDATIEPREPAHAGGPPSASVWYRWTARARRNVQIDTCDSDFDTELAVYVRDTLESLLGVAGNDDACRTRSIVRFDAVPGTTYSIAVDGFELEQGSIRLAIQPSNNLRITQTTRNEREGTAQLLVRVPNPGGVVLAGTGQVRRATARARAVGSVRLTVRPRGRALRRLDETGRARLRVAVTFTPDAGRPNTVISRVTLVKRG